MQAVNNRCDIEPQSNFECIWTQWNKQKTFVSSSCICIMWCHSSKWISSVIPWTFAISTMCRKSTTGKIFDKKIFIICDYVGINRELSEQFAYFPYCNITKGLWQSLRSFVNCIIKKLLQKEQVINITSTYVQYD